MDVKDAVRQAMEEVFGDRDPSAVDRWMAPEYRQHSKFLADGRDGLRSLVADLPDDHHYTLVRAVADGDLVLLHGTARGLGPVPLVLFDLFRVTDGTLVEHWDGAARLTGRNVSGRTQIDGPTEPSDPDRTEANRALVTRFAETILRDGRRTALAEFVSDGSYAQHSTNAPDGVEHFWSAAPDGGLDYRAIHHVVAEGDTVLVHAEAAQGDRPVACWDLFRVADGRIVEHWDVLAPVAASAPHTNGAF